MEQCKCGGMVTDCLGELPDDNNPCICDKLKIKKLTELLDRVDSEFGELSQLDCPEYVCPNEDLWEEITKELKKK